MSTYILDETPQARRELAASQYGQHQNAEDLIRSHFASIPPEVRSGLRLAENPDGLARAKDDDAGSTIEVPEGGRLVEWTVRGTDPRRMVLSYIWEDESGRWHHGVQGYNDQYEAPDETPADRALREVAMADHAVRKAGAEGNALLDEKMEAFRREQEAVFGERFAALKDELVATLQSIAAKADEGSKSESRSKSEPPPPGKKADETGESGKGDKEQAPPPGDESTSEGGDGGEVKWPHTHDDMDALAKSGGLKKADLPEDWDDRNLDAKREFLSEKGVKPEAQG